jgi:hypothetical protein
MGVKSVKRISTKVEEKIDNAGTGLLISMLPALPILIAEFKKWSDKKKREG